MEKGLDLEKLKALIDQGEAIDCIDAGLLITEVEGSVDAERVIQRMESEIRPLLDEDKYHGGYDCCGCSTYDAILDHAIRVIREELAQ